MRKEGGRWSFSAADYRVIQAWLRQKARMMDVMMEWVQKRRRRR